MRTHSLISRLAALVVLAGLAAAGPPAQAEFWNGPNSTGVYNTLINTSTGVNMTAYFGYDSNGKSTWRTCMADNDNSTKQIDCEASQVYHNGQQLGGTYRAPDAPQNAGPLGIRWDTPIEGSLTEFDRREMGTLRLSTDATQQLTRTTIEAGRPPSNPLKNYHPSAYYWNPSEPGIGWAIETQGDSFFAAVYHYDTNGDPIWSFTTGVMTSASSYSGTLQRCTKSGSTVTCSSLGAISMTFYLQFPGAPTSYRIMVLLPGGTTTVLQQFRF